MRKIRKCAYDKESSRFYVLGQDLAMACIALCTISPSSVEIKDLAFKSCFNLDVLDGFNAVYDDFEFYENRFLAEPLTFALTALDSRIGTFERVTTKNAALEDYIKLINKELESFNEYR